MVAGRHPQADQTHCPDSGTKVSPWSQEGNGWWKLSWWPQADLPDARHAPVGYPHQQGRGSILILVFLCLGMSLFLLGRCSVFVSEGILFFCSSFPCPSNTKLHEYFHWHERVPPPVSDTGSPARNYLCFCLAGTHLMMEASESSHTE